MSDIQPRQVAAPGAAGRQNQLGQAMGAKGRQTRRRLLDATERLLRTVPLRELSVAQIAKAAGTSTSTFYVYFDGVPEAVLELTGEFSQSPPNLLGLVARRWPAADAVSRAYDFVSGYVEQYEAHAPLFRVRNLASDEGDRRFTEQRVNAVAPLLAAMAARIQERQGAGELPLRLDPVSTAGTLLALLERIAVMPASSLRRGVSRARLLDVAAFFSVLLFADGAVPFAASTVQGDDEPEDVRPEPAARSERAAEARLVAGLKNQQGQTLGPKGETTRRRILQAVSDLIQSHSLMSLKVSDIVRAARASNSTFYLYFQDVPQAVLALLADAPQSTPDLMSLLDVDWSRGPCDDRAAAFVSGYLRQWQANRALFRIRNLAADEGDERFTAARVDSIGPLLSRLTDRIEDCQRRGQLPQGLHPRAAAGSFLAMLERLAATPSLDESRVTMVVQAAAYLLTVLLCGVRARQAAFE